MNIKAILGFLVTVILFIILFKDLDLELLFTYLQKGNISYIIVGVGIYLCSFIIRGLRWKLLMHNLKEIHLGETVQLTVAGYAVNNVLPTRLGEFTRAYLMGNRNKISRTSALASVFVERIFDGLTIVLILSIILYIYPFPGWVQSLSKAGSIIFSILFLIILISSFSQIPTKLLLFLEKKLPAFFNPVFNIGHKFLDGIKTIDSIGTLVKLLALSFAIWGTEIIVYITVLHAFDIDVPLIAYFLMLVTVNLGMLIPSTPGGLGVFQFAVVKSLEIFSILSTRAMAVSLVLHMVQIIPVTIIGLLWLYMHHISIKRISDENSETT